MRAPVLSDWIKPPARGVDIAQLAVQYSVANKDISTCIIGSANPENVKKWVEWADKPVDQQLMDEVLRIALESEVKALPLPPVEMQQPSEEKLTH